MMTRPSATRAHVERENGCGAGATGKDRSLQSPNGQRNTYEAKSDEQSYAGQSP